MKRIITLIVAVLFSLVSFGAAYADGYRNENPYFTDEYTVQSEDGNRIVYEFISDKHLSLKSTTSGTIRVELEAETNTTMEKLGFTSLKVQRWNGTTWVTDEETTNQFSYSTDSFNYNDTFTGLSSGYQYRVKVTLRAKRTLGEVQDLTITSNSIICH